MPEQYGLDQPELEDSLRASMNQIQQAQSREDSDKK
jgi:hypothetical protein